MDILPESACLPGLAHPGLTDFATLVAELPSAQREIITMLKVSGMSLEEVAQATRSSVGSVKQKAHRAYEKLRALKGKSGSQRGVQPGRDHRDDT
jgi:RNA polymerase sigma-70 factor (ECF subfamily)